MYISPCGWYCIDTPEYWEIQEVDQGVLLKHAHLETPIKINSIRTNLNKIDEISIMEEHENVTHSMKGHHEIARGSSKSGLAVITSTIQKEDLFHVLCHLFWSKYAIRIEFSCLNKNEIAQLVQTFNHITQHIQTLTNDQRNQ
jgi:hypothetical protein